MFPPSTHCFITGELESGGTGLPLESSVTFTPTQLRSIDGEHDRVIFHTTTHATVDTNGRLQSSEGASPVRVVIPLMGPDESVILDVTIESPLVADIWRGQMTVAAGETHSIVNAHPILTPEEREDIGRFIELIHEAEEYAATATAQAASASGAAVIAGNAATAASNAASTATDRAQAAALSAADATGAASSASASATAAAESETSADTAAGLSQASASSSLSAAQDATASATAAQDAASIANAASEDAVTARDAAEASAAASATSASDAAASAASVEAPIVTGTNAPVADPDDPIGQLYLRTASGGRVTALFIRESGGWTAYGLDSDALGTAGLVRYGAVRIADESTAIAGTAHAPIAVSPLSLRAVLDDEATRESFDVAPLAPNIPLNAVLQPVISVSVQSGPEGVVIADVEGMIDRSATGGTYRTAAAWSTLLDSSYVSVHYTAADVGVTRQRARHILDVPPNSTVNISIEAADSGSLTTLILNDATKRFSVACRGY